MTENETKNWEEARARLVEQRQSIVKALAKSRRIKNDIDLLIKIQAGIDVLDKAKHEIFRLSIDSIGRSEKTARYASAYNGAASKAYSVINPRRSGSRSGARATSAANKED